MLIHYNIILYFVLKVNLLPVAGLKKNSDFLIGVLFIYAKFLPIIFRRLFWLPCLYAGSLKAVITASLKGQFPHIPLWQQSVFPAWKAQLHAVPAFYLKGGIVAGPGVDICGTAVRTVLPFCHHLCRYCQHRRVVVVVPFPDSFYKHHHKRCYDDCYNYKEKNWE